MTIRKVLTYPNPALRKPARLVSLEEIKTDEFAELVGSLRFTLASIGGAALAANQVGIDRRMFVDKSGKLFINPSLRFLWNEIDEDIEGCLSFPEIKILKKRMYKVSMTFFDENGDEFEHIATDFEARVWQHECEHLDGETFIDHLSENQKRRIAMRIAKRGNGNVR